MKINELDYVIENEIWKVYRNMEYKEIQNIHEKIYREQEVAIYAYTAFINLLKYQKEIIQDEPLWQAYINGIQKMFTDDLEGLK